MEYTPENYEKVKQALLDCQKMLTTLEDVPDKGTHNNDTVTLYFEKWPKAKIQSLPFIGRKLEGRWWKKNWVLNFDYKGMCNLRNYICEKANDFLKERGVPSCIFYQMD